MGFMKVSIERGRCRSGLLSPGMAAGGRRAAWLVVVVLLGVLCNSPVFAIEVSRPEDICAADADPCVVDDKYEIVHDIGPCVASEPETMRCRNWPLRVCETDEDCLSVGGHLDFGVQDILIESSGRFDFGGRDGSISCGTFVAAPSNTVAINLTHNGMGGRNSIRARRACANEVSYACLSDAYCDRGACDVRRCTDAPSLACSTAQECSFGPCVDFRCEANSEFSCLNNSDCDFGDCPDTSWCNRDPSRACVGDDDCDLGLCSVGTGSIDLAAPVDGFGDEPAWLNLRAADDVNIGATINLSSKHDISDGGDLDVVAYQGSITVTAKINVMALAANGGGFVDLLAKGDVTIDGPIDANGGQYGGGDIYVTAGGDVVITEDLLANSTVGGDWGGDIGVRSGGSIWLGGGTSGRRTRIETSGSSGPEPEASGGGGYQMFEAVGDVFVGEFVGLESNGAAPYGSGGEIDLIAENGSLVLSGWVQSKPKSSDAESGGVYLLGGSSATVESSAKIDLLGGGYLEVRSPSGPVRLDGRVDATPYSADDTAGGMRVFSAANADIGATLTIGKGHEGLVQVQACRVRVLADAVIRNSTDNGANRLTARETLAVDAGAEIKASGEEAANVFTFRDPDSPPSILGTVDPDPILVLDEDIAPCPVCGNAKLEFGETCDDGGVEDGDGCTSTCVNEGCIAATPGYPDVALCDDGSSCTADSCDVVTGECQHTIACDDQVDCTVDECIAEACVSSPDDTLCDDGNQCTDDSCLAREGCMAVPRSDACDDGSPCTLNDACAEGACIGEPIQCDDSIGCTDDYCEESTGLCAANSNHTACDNDLFCDGSEICDPETGCIDRASPNCSVLDWVCGQGVCDEANDGCRIDPAREGLACDDADICTESDACADGRCEGTSIPGCSVCGDGVVEELEQCDDGDSHFEPGQFCTQLCTVLQCGHPTGGTAGLPLAADALFTLRTAVELAHCDLCLCDTDGSADVTASDALRLLNSAVQVPVILLCPSCV